MVDFHTYIHTQTTNHDNTWNSFILRKHARDHEN